MLGMEMMLSNMIGMKPDEMKKAVNDVMNAIMSAAKSLTEIKETMERLENKIDDLGDKKNGRAITNRSNDSANHNHT